MDDPWDPILSSLEYAYLPRNPSGFSYMYKGETNVARKGNVSPLTAVNIVNENVKGVYEIKLEFKTGRMA